MGFNILVNQKLSQHIKFHALVLLWEKSVIRGVQLYGRGIQLYSFVNCIMYLVDTDKPQTGLQNYILCTLVKYDLNLNITPNRKLVVVPNKKYLLRKNIVVGETHIGLPPDLHHSCISYSNVLLIINFSMNMMCQNRNGNVAFLWDKNRPKKMINS